MRNNLPKLDERLQEITDLLKERDGINAKLAKLTGIGLPNVNAPQT